MKKIDNILIFIFSGIFLLVGSWYGSRFVYQSIELSQKSIETETKRLEEISKKVENLQREIDTLRFFIEKHKGKFTS